MTRRYQVKAAVADILCYDGISNRHTNTYGHIRDMMTKQPFPLTFTAGGLFAHEGRLLAQRLLDGQDWESIRQAVFSENLLQVTRKSSVTRLYGELHKRMLTLNPRQLLLLVHGQSGEQNAVLWLAACRHYPFVAAFANVIHQRYLALQYDFDDSEYWYFYAQLANHHDRLNHITRNTQNKMRTVIYKMAREAEILNNQKQITGLFLSSDFIDTLSHHDELLYFPTRV